MYMYSVCSQRCLAFLGLVTFDMTRPILQWHINGIAHHPVRFFESHSMTTDMHNVRSS